MYNNSISIYDNLLTPETSLLTTCKTDFGNRHGKVNLSRQILKTPLTIS